MSVTSQDKETVMPWVEKHGATFPILCKANSSAYSKGGIPHSILIGAEGKVLWQGHPSEINDGMIEGYLKDVKKGDRVLTNGGIFGTVTTVADDVITLQVADGVRMKFARSAVQGLVDPARESEGGKNGDDKNGDD